MTWKTYVAVLTLEVPYFEAKRNDDDVIMCGDDVDNDE